MEAQVSNSEEQKPQKSYTIIVNGKQRIVHDNVLTFSQVVALADELPKGDNVMYTVMYRKSDGHKKEGTLVDGDSVKIKDGTVFDVTATDKS
jgi:hypothetical protein